MKRATLRKEAVRPVRRIKTLRHLALSHQVMSGMARGQVQNEHR